MVCAPVNRLVEPARIRVRRAAQMSARTRMPLGTLDGAGLAVVADHDDDVGRQPPGLTRIDDGLQSRSGPGGQHADS
jgi:hypothetical protein